MPGLPFVPDFIARGDFRDLPAAQPADDGKAAVWNHANQAFEYVEVEAAGLAAQLLAAHVADGNAHPLYAKLAGGNSFTGNQKIGNGNYFAFTEQSNVSIDHQWTEPLDDQRPYYQGAIIAIEGSPVSVDTPYPGIYGIGAYAGTADGDNTDWRQVSQLTGYVDLLGSGNVHEAYGYAGQVYNEGSGILTSAYGLFVFIANYGSGSITNTFGMYPEMNGDGVQNQYAIYVPDVLGASDRNYALYTNRGDVRLMSDPNDKIGLHGATPVARPTITGSRAGNAALAGLLAALAARGDIVDSTTA